MRIVPQSAPVSYSLFPVMLALPAPRIAGLLTAYVPSSTQITVIKQQPRQSLLDRQRAIWAAQDAELEEFLAGARQRLVAVIAEVEYKAYLRSLKNYKVEVLRG